MPSSAVLLLNLGSPDSPAVADVRRYLLEFLGDPRVIDRPQRAWLRSLLVRFIVARRARASAHAYSTVWTAKGAPLIVTSREVQEAAQRRVDIPVELAMNYGNPSIANAIARLRGMGVQRLLLFPQYPHYAMSSWETVVAKARSVAAELAPGMRLDCVAPFYSDDDYIDALVRSAKPYLSRDYDHLLFSYHGIPTRHLRQADSSHAHCEVVPDCCLNCSPAHATCYKAQVTRTTHDFAKKAGLAPGKWSMSFQSRLGREPWIEPSTEGAIRRLAASGCRRLLVITPAFTTDCLETIEEIRERAAAEFLAAGGSSFEHIPCLNDHPAWIDVLASRIKSWNTAPSPIEIASQRLPTTEAGNLSRVSSTARKAAAATS